jgi:hypothetical protein
MIDYAEKVKALASAYHSGIYTKDEAVGSIMGLLEDSPDFRALWIEIPEWAQVPIQEYLKGCHESTVLYDFSSGSSTPISPTLLTLKSWLEMK